MHDPTSERQESPALVPPSISTLKPPASHERQPLKSIRTSITDRIYKSRLPYPEPRRICDRDHVRFVAKQPCLICGRKPADSHHIRFTQQRALGRKVSDEFTVPLCRGHYRAVHPLATRRAGGKKPALIRPQPLVRCGSNPTLFRRDGKLKTPKAHAPKPLTVDTRDSLAARTQNEDANPNSPAVTG